MQHGVGAGRQRGVGVPGRHRARRRGPPPRGGAVVVERTREADDGDRRHAAPPPSSPRSGRSRGAARTSRGPGRPGRRRDLELDALADPHLADPAEAELRQRARRRPGPGGRAPRPSASPSRPPGSPRHLRDALVGLPVPGTRPLHHLGRELRRRRRVVPADLVQPVAQVLLVERGRALPRAPTGRPARGASESGVTRLVAEHQAPPGSRPSSNLVSARMIPARRASLGRAGVEREGDRARPRRALRSPTISAASVAGDVHVVALGRLGRRA